MKEFIISEYSRLKVVFLSCSVSIALVAFRMKISHDLHYLFLVWNLFLALIPLFIAYGLQEKICAKNKIQVALFFFIWLIFLPNAPYILTDFIHLSYSPKKWFAFDLLMIASFAASGLVAGLISVKITQDLFVYSFSEKSVRYALGIIFLLCGYGIYLGRFWRYNSWHLITEPFQLIKDCFSTVVHPFVHWQVWLFTLIFGVFLYGIYFMGKPYFCQNPKSTAYARKE